MKTIYSTGLLALTIVAATFPSAAKGMENQNPTETSDTVRSIISDANIGGRHFVLDNKYFLPSKKEIFGPFYKSFVRWVRRQAPVLRDTRGRDGYAYIKDGADCDNRAFWFISFGSFWNIDRQSEQNRGSLAMFVISYRRDYDKKFHTVNFFLANSLEIHFIEPGNGKELFLSTQEKQSANFVISF